MICVESPQDVFRVRVVNEEAFGSALVERGL